MHQRKEERDEKHFATVNHKKRALSLIKIFLFLSKKAQRQWMNFKIPRAVNDNQTVQI